MLQDIENQLAKDQAFTADAVTEHSYQKQSAAQDPSIGRMMCLLFVVKVAAGAGSTWSFQAVQADVTALTTNVEILASSALILAADLPVGAKVAVPIPQGSLDRLHVGGKATVETGGTETITLDCYYCPLDEVEAFKSFPRVPAAPVV